MSKLHDIALERGYISQLILFPNERHFASAERLDPMDCANIENARILSAVYELAAAKASIETISVQRLLERSGAAPATIHALDSVSEAAIRVEPPRVMAERLRELAKARRLREELAKALACVDAMNFEDAHEHMRVGLGERGEGRVRILNAYQTVQASLTGIRNGNEGAVYRTDLPVLDRSFGGLRRRTMLTLGGTTGSGKSSLMLKMARNAVALRRRPGIVSIEDAEQIWGPRILSGDTDLSPSDLEGEQISSDFIAKAEEGLAAAKMLGIEFAYTLNAPLATVLEAIRELVTTRGCTEIYVDYVQAIMLKRAKGETRAEVVSSAAQRIKAQCQDLNVPLVLGSQLSRPTKGDEFREPTIFNLKETGDLENMSDVIVLLWATGDDDDAKTIGKVAKWKNSKKRPRFEIERDARTGAIISLLPIDPPPKPQPDEGHEHTNGNGRKRKSLPWEKRA